MNLYIYRKNQTTYLVIHPADIETAVLELPKSIRPVSYTKISPTVLIFNGANFYKLSLAKQRVVAI